MKTDLNILGNLIRRGLKLYFSDKMAVFLSVLSPLIILFLYLMFLGDVQYDTVISALGGLEVSDRAAHAFINSWMVAGVLAVSCITVSFCTQSIMIRDREVGVVSDMLTSPIKRGVLSAGYFIVNLVITAVVVAVILVLALIYLAATGWYLSVADIFKLFGILAMSVLSACLFTTIVAMFIRTQAAHGGASGILSAAIGFFIGAYMPMYMFPKAIQYLVLFIPGTYSAGTLRNIFMRGALEAMLNGLPEPAVQPVKQKLSESFSMRMDAFGTAIGEKEMWIIFACTIVLFAVAYVVNQIVRAKTDTLFSSPRREKIVKR